MESGKLPHEQDVEIEGTEPYIVGGHTASGYWIDTARRTTLPGLYAGGDVAGGCPQKYVTGALVEGEIVAKTILSDLEERQKATSERRAEEKRRRLREERISLRRRKKSGNMNHILQM